ncbi:hypothetical protein GGS26DRAFT_538109 [Hypomontagnella submonticulosa]|nr:hypothetical protein GGS26DRAFT_538109 [Hypomontagnella submonticulosa]
MSDSDDRGPPFRAYTIVMMVIPVVAVSLRLWSRALNMSVGRHSTRFWWDDWVAILATLFVIGQEIVILEWLSIGFGRHAWTLPPENVALFAKLLFVSFFFYDITLFLSRASALLFLSRIFPKYTNSKVFNYALWITHAVNVGWVVSEILAFVFFCDPVARSWDRTIPGTCGVDANLYIGNAVPSVAIDLTILILPLPKVWRLHTSTARKWAITCVFILGYCVIVLSIGRLVTVLITGDALNIDVTYEGVPVFYWATAESPITILCVCLPALLPLARHLGNEYFEPLAQRMTSMLTSRTNQSSFRSKTGDFAQRQSGDGDKDTFGETESQDRIIRPSGQSNRKLNLSTTDDYYAAHIRGHEAGGPWTTTIPLDSIRVDKDVEVSRSQS